MKITRSEYLALLRQDFSGFIERSFAELNPQTDYLHNWHIDVIAEALEECRLGKTRKLIINLPPRSLKSHCASIAFPAWLLGHNPSEQIICASYAQDLSDKLALDCRSLLETQFYQELFLTRLSKKKNAVNEFTTMMQGMRLATGRGADFIIIDDPLKPDEALSESQRRAVNEWYDHTLCSRLNNKQTGCIIVIMQRLHEDDLIGHIQKYGDWKVLKFPAIAEENERYVCKGGIFTRKVGEALHPEREPLAVLQSLREQLGEYNFAGQYQQSPAPLGGGMIKAEWFKTCPSADWPALKDFTLVYQSWDTANKSTELSDYSVCTTWGRDKHNKLYVLDVFRQRLDYPALKRAVRFMAEQFNAKTILIEDKASGTQLIQELISEGVHGITGYETKLDKVMRMHSVSSTIENGFVYLPEKADWLATFRHELTVFPNGKHDDQVDSTSQALDWIRKGRTGIDALTEYYRRSAEEAERHPRSHNLW